MNNSLRTFASFAVGVGAGLAAGYLTAPRSGKKTREKIVQDMEEVKNSMEKTANKKIKEAKQYIDEKIDGQVEKGKKALNKMKEATSFNN